MTELEAKNLRDRVDVKIRDGLEKAVRDAVARFEAYEKGCSFCRMLNDSLIRRFTAGTVVVYDCGLEQRGNAFYCPKCKRCTYSSER